jgi:hypothetical protein
LRSAGYGNVKTKKKKNQGKFRLINRFQHIFWPCFAFAI